MPAEEQVNVMVDQFYRLVDGINKRLDDLEQKLEDRYVRREVWDQSTRFHGERIGELEKQIVRAEEQRVALRKWVYSSVITTLALLVSFIGLIIVIGDHI